MKRVVSEPGSPATNGAPGRELLVAFEAFHVPIGEKQRPDRRARCNNGISHRQQCKTK
jgi:hypothetical protein